LLVNRKNKHIHKLQKKYPQQLSQSQATVDLTKAACSVVHIPKSQKKHPIQPSQPQATVNVTKAACTVVPAKTEKAKQKDWSETELTIVEAYWNGLIPADKQNKKKGLIKVLDIINKNPSSVSAFNPRYLKWNSFYDKCIKLPVRNISNSYFVIILRFDYFSSSLIT
jgi:hypothetical protein